MACAKVITKYDKSGSLVLNHDVLHEMMTKLDKCKRRFAIISIVGQMRTGKSFLMNFLIRCLRNGGPQNKGWMGDEKTSLDEGIVWRGGVEPETKGIHIWDEIFTLRKENGEEISVLLMDTQGLFDHDTVPGNNVKLSTLSTLASSVQILNVFRQITERDLEYLQFCVQYAVAIANTGSGKFKLQDLLLLLRDWTFTEEYPCGLESGYEYLKTVLRRKGRNSELNTVREHIEKSFEKVTCYLMPHPGMKVKLGRNKDLHPDFLEQVQIFTNHLLNPDNLALKTMNGAELANFLMACENSFISGELPKVTNILEATAKAFWYNKYEKCLQRYIEILESELHINAKTKDELQDIHSMAMDKVLLEFDRQQEFFSSANYHEYREHLEKQCFKQYKIFQEKNDIKTERVQLEIETYLQIVVEKYKENMNEACGSKSIEGGQLESLHIQYHHKALKSIQEFTHQYLTLRKQSEIKLQKRLEKIFERIIKENESRRAYEKLAKEKCELPFIKDLLKSYRFELRQKLSEIYTPPENLKTDLKRKLQETLQKFDKLITRSDQYTRNFRQYFLKDLENENQELLKQNEKNKKQLLDKLKMMHNAKILEFRARMTKILHSAYIDPETLRKNCNDGYQKDMNSFLDQIPDVKDDSDFQMLLDQVEHDYKRTIESLMEDNKLNKSSRFRLLKNIPHFKPDAIDKSLITAALGGTLTAGLSLLAAGIFPPVAPVAAAVAGDAFIAAAGSAGAYVVKKTGEYGVRGIKEAINSDKES